MSHTSTNPNANVNPTTPAGPVTHAIGGTSSTDIEPAWGQSLPAWADMFIALLASGQMWPKGSESLLWELAKAHQAHSAALAEGVDPGVSAGKAVLAGWHEPASEVYMGRVTQTLAGDGGLVTLGNAHQVKAVQVDDYARETQYSKISVNVAFWIGITAFAIAAIAWWFTAGATTPLIGRYALWTRTKFDAIFARLAAVARRSGGSALTTRLAAFHAALPAPVRTVLANHVVRHVVKEMIEEAGEEGLIDYKSQKTQIDMGTRKDWDWKKTNAALLGGGGGGIGGIALNKPMTWLADRVPIVRRLSELAENGSGATAALAGFGRDAAHTGINNMAASPLGSILANGVVYGQWDVAGAFTGESLVGAFAGGAGRTRSISPTNPDVLLALARPMHSIQVANTMAARNDAARAARMAGQTGAAGGGSNPSGPSGPSGPAAGPSGSPSGPATPSSGPSAPPATVGTRSTGPAAQAAGPAPSAGGPAGQAAGPAPSTGGPANPSGGPANPAGGAAAQGGGSGQSSSGAPANPSGSGAPASGTGSTPASQAAPQGANAQTGQQPGPTQTGGQQAGPAQTGNQQTGPAAGQQPDPSQTGGSQQAGPTGGQQPDPGQTGNQQTGPASTGAPAGGQAAPSASSPAPQAGTTPQAGPSGQTAPQTTPTAAAGQATPSSPNAATATQPAGPTGPQSGTGNSTTAQTPATGAAPAPQAAPTPPGPLFMPGMPQVVAASTTPAPAQAAPTGAQSTNTQTAQTAGTPNAQQNTGNPNGQTNPNTPNAQQGTGTPNTQPNTGNPNGQTNPGTPNAQQGTGTSNTQPNTGNPNGQTNPGTPNAQQGTSGQSGQSGAGNQAQPNSGAQPAAGQAAAPDTSGTTGGSAPASGATPSGTPYNGPDDPRVHRRVNTLLSRILTQVAPDALPLDDGTIRMTGPDGRPLIIPADAVARLHRRLRVRMADGAQRPRLRVEAAALLGFAMARAAHTAPMEGALNALGRIVADTEDVPRIVTDVAREVVGDRWERVKEAGLTRDGLRVAEAANGPLPDASFDYDTMRVGPLEEQRKAISDQAENLGTDLARQPSGTNTATSSGPNATTSGTPNPATSSGPNATTSGTPNTAAGPQAGGTSTTPNTTGTGGPRNTTPAARPAQGVIRGALQAAQNPLTRATNAFNAYVEARYAEYRHLVELWTNGGPEPRRVYRAGIRRVIDDLTAHGQPAPVPPWSTQQLHTVAPDATTSPSSATSTAAAPNTGSSTPANAAPAPNAVPAPVADLAERVQRIRASLERTQAGLEEREAENRNHVREAKKREKEAREKADKAKKEKDSWGGERRRAQLQEARLERIAAEHYRHIANNYQKALTQARELAKAYKALSEALDRIASGQDPTPVADLAAEVARLAREADAAFAEFDKAMVDSRPPQELLALGLSTGRLPYLTALTNAVNQELADKDVNDPYTAEELLGHLRADTQRLISEDGVILRRGHGKKRVELRIVLDLGEPVEVTKPGVKASEVMIGSLPQGGSSVQAMISRVLNLAFGPNVAPLIAAIPEDGGLLSALKRFAKAVALGIKGNVGHSESVSASHAEYVLDGQVADDRGDSTKVSVKGSYRMYSRVLNRRGAPGAWTSVATVDKGVGNDRTEVGLHLSHAHTTHAPDQKFTLPDGEPRGRFPRYVPLHVEGLDALADEVLTAGEPMNDDLREQIRKILTTDLPAHLKESVDDVYEEVVIAGGRRGVLRVRTTVVSAKMASRPGWKQFQEWLGVSFSGTTAATSAGRSSGVTIGGERAPSDGSTGFFAKVRDILAAWFGLKGKLSLSLTRGSSRSDGAISSRVGIFPQVRRWMGRTNTYDTTLRHDVTLHFPNELRNHVTNHLPGRGPSTVTRSANSRMFLQTPEPDAGRAGWEVDAAAVRRTKNGTLIRNPDGTVRFRDDPVQKPPPGRKPEAPAWMNQIPGGGPATLFLNPDELAEMRDHALTTLREQGHLPEVDENGLPKPSLDPQRARAQLDNLAEVRKQLSDNALQTRISQGAQDGILLHLKRVTTGGPIQHVTVLVGLKPVGEPAYQGLSEAEGHVELNIMSNTALRVRNFARKVAISFNLGLERIAKKLGFHWSGFGFGYNFGLSRSAGWGMGYTLNEVTLTEGAPTAMFGQKYRVTMHQVHGDGSRQSLLSPEVMGKLVSGTLFMPASLLPDANAPAHAPVTVNMSTDDLRHMTLLGMNVTGMQDAFYNVLPRHARADSEAHHVLGAFGNVRTFMADTAWLYTQHRIDVILRAQGLHPTSARVGVDVSLGESTLVGVGNLVNADIALALLSNSTNMDASRSNEGSANVGWGWGRWGPKWNGSASRSGGRSSSQASIVGREPITVQTGKTYIFTAPVNYTVTGEHGRSNSRQDVVSDRTVLYALPELNVLTRYADGAFPLPLHLAADAVERYLNGHLRLEPTLAMRVVRRYVQQRAEAMRQQAVPAGSLIAGHTEDELFSGLSKRLNKDLDKPAKKLDDFFHPVRYMLKKVRVALPKNSGRRMGLTTFDSVDLYRTSGDSKGDRASVLDAVLEQVRKVFPGAELSDLVMDRALVGMLVGDNWWGTVRNQLTPTGLSWEQPVRVGPHQTELLRINLKTEFVNEMALLHSRDDESVDIDQVYGYEETGESRSSGYGVGTGVGTDVPGGQVAGSVGGGTHRGHGKSKSEGEQFTDIEREASFDGSDLVSQIVRVTVSAERVSLPAGRRGNFLTRPLHALARLVRRGTHALNIGTRNRVRHAGIETAPEPIVLVGTAVRRVPDGLTVRAEQNRPLPDPLPDARPQELPDNYYPAEVVADDLPGVALAALADLIGPEGVEEQRVRVTDALLPMALTAKFKLMFSPQGHRMVRLHLPGNVKLDVMLHASAPTEEQLIVGPRENIERGDARRRQNNHGHADDRNQLTPVSRNGEVKEEHAGSVSVSSGDQVGDHTSSSGGMRKEKTLNEKGRMVESTFRVGFKLSFRISRVRRNGTERVVRVVEVPTPVVGSADLVMSEEDYKAMLDRQRTAQPGRGWSLNEEPGRRRLPWRRSPSGHPSQSLTSVVNAARGNERFDQDQVAAVTAELLGRLPRGYTGPITLHVTAAPADLPVPVAWARLLSRQLLGRPVRLTVHEPGTNGEVRTYVAAEGRLSSEEPDGGFAAAMETLPTEVAATAVLNGLNLRTLYNQSERSRPFVEEVEAALRRLGVAVPQQAGTIFPQPLWGPGPQEESGPAALAALGVSAPVHPESGFVKGRAPESGPLDDAEMRRAWATIDQAVLGDNILLAAWPDGSPVVTVIDADLGQVQFSPGVGTVAPENMASTDLNAGPPHPLTLDPDTPEHLVARTLVHEVSHALRELKAIAQGTPQGMIRGRLAAPDPAARIAASEDACAQARVDEYRHMANEWARAAPERRAELKDEMEGLARLITARGKTPPPAPWLAQVPAPRPSIASLINAPAPAAPANPGRPPRSPDDEWARLRRLSNSTGWIPPDEDGQCTCPPGGPCTCGKRPSSPSSPQPSSPSPSPSSPQPSSPQPSSPAPSSSPVTVRPGDTLQKIASRWLGPGATPEEIDQAAQDWYQANREVIGDDPNVLDVGQDLVPPQPEPASKGTS
ncbi:WXG100-like domain-containing protein [Sphaerisporangium fuscum]|uniref:WXG100-like domain-containing protein n=1 Tax=Sphaerisporangium fuscum TaxID=2835868 RepID=UPI001BDBB700|nr:hypothetical protein [Sphaerisporangium fuscum]